jgi:hypothetical protein
MGVTAADAARYENAVRRLFPQGEYWDAQFAGPQSDVSLFAKAKAAELARFIERKNALLGESNAETTTELIADWERVYLDGVYPGLDINQRRLQLKSRNDLKLNRAELQKTAAMFGLNIKDVKLPYSPRFFGFAKFAVERLGSFTAFSVARITASESGFEAKHWAAVKTELGRSRFARARFGLGRLAYFPVCERGETVWRNLRQGCFGSGRFAQDTLAPFPVDAARRLAGERLDGMRVTRLFFGHSRLPLFSGRFAPSLVSDCDFLGGYVESILRSAAFNRRFELVLLDEYVTRAKPYHEFEQATRAKLLANQIAIFSYKENNYERNVSQ